MLSSHSRTNLHAFLIRLSQELVTALQSNRLSVVYDIWNENLLLREWFIGKEILFDLNNADKPIKLAISNEELITNFKHLLTRKITNLIEIMWYENKRLHQAIEGLNSGDSISLLLKVMSSSLHGKNDFIVNYVNFLNDFLVIDTALEQIKSKQHKKNRPLSFKKNQISVLELRLEKWKKNYSSLNVNQPPIIAINNHQEVISPLNNTGLTKRKIAPPSSPNSRKKPRMEKNPYDVPVIENNFNNGHVAITSPREELPTPQGIPWLFESRNENDLSQETSLALQNNNEGNSLGNPTNICSSAHSPLFFQSSQANISMGNLFEEEEIVILSTSSELAAMFSQGEDVNNPALMPNNLAPTLFGYQYNFDSRIENTAPERSANEKNMDHVSSTNGQRKSY